MIGHSVAFPKPAWFAIKDLGPDRQNFSVCVCWGGGGGVNSLNAFVFFVSKQYISVIYVQSV